MSEDQNETDAPHNEPREVSMSAVSAFACAVAEVLIEKGLATPKEIQDKFLDHIMLTDKNQHAEAEKRFMATLGFQNTTEFRKAYEQHLKSKMSDTIKTI